MKVWMIVVPILALLVIGGAIAAYLIVAPPTLADDYEKKAEPEHTKIEDALIPVGDSLNVDTFGTVPLSSKLSGAKYLRKYRSVAAQDKRELKRAQRQLRKAKRALADADEEAMTDAPSWPLLGGDLDEAKDLAKLQADYLRKARAFLKGYEELIEYELFVNPVFDRLNIADAEAEMAVPERPTSPGQISRPLERLVRVATTELKRMQRRKPPAEVKRSHRKAITEIRTGIADHRALIAAINRRDLGRVDTITKRIKRTSKSERKASRKELSKLVYGSRYAKQIKDLERREDRISKAFEAL